MAINSKNYSATIGTSAQVVSEAKLGGNSERVRLVLSNQSTGGEIISISVDSDPVAGSGLVLSPGGSVTWEKQTFPIQQGRVLAICSGAAGKLAIYEEVNQ